MRHSKTKVITSASLRRETKNRSKIVRRNIHKDKNKFLEYIKMLFF